MSMINKEINDFSVQAYQNGEFKTITKNDIMKEWSLFFFYPADFTFVCPTELEDRSFFFSSHSYIFPWFCFKINTIIPINRYIFL